MLPTVGDRIEHFLSAYLGLSDERRWRSKVDNKLKRVKSAIQGLRERVAATASAENHAMKTAGGTGGGMHTGVEKSPQKIEKTTKK